MSYNTKLSRQQEAGSFHRGVEKEIYSFSVLKMSKIEAIGNQILGIHNPTPRSGHRIVTANGNVYSFGGYNPITVENVVTNEEVVDHILFKELWSYNCTSKTWRHLKTSGNIPDELASHCAVYYDNHLLIFGGTAYPFGLKTSNDVHVCNLKNLQWFKLETSGTPPQKQYGQAMLLHEKNLYVVGGTTGYTYSNEVHCLNLLTKEWKKLSGNPAPTYESRFTLPEYKPEPRYRHEIALYENKIYVFGGGTASESFSLSELPVFDLNTNSWVKLQTNGDTIDPRRCHSLVQVYHVVYIFGGFDGLHTFDDISMIDLKTLTWQKCLKLPYPLYFHSTAATDSHQLFLFGGINGRENQRTNDMHTMWLKIPSLATMCWQAVNYYVPNLAQMKRRKLFEIGIPFRFLDEIEFYSEISTIPETLPMPETVSLIEESEDEWEML